MKRFLVSCLAALTAISLTSCLSTQEPTCTSSGYVPIVSARGPKTVGVNQPAVFTVGYTLGTDCGTFSNVAAVPNGNTVQVGVAAAFNGCACNANTTVSQTSYQFQSATPGTYYFQFVGLNNSYIADTVVVK